MKLPLIVYLFGLAGAYVFLSQRLVLVHKDNKEEVKLTKQTNKIKELCIICFSITWFISLPVLYYKAINSEE